MKNNIMSNICHIAYLKRGGINDQIEGMLNRGSKLTKFNALTGIYRY